jgi:hypothetical protein
MAFISVIPIPAPSERSGKWDEEYGEWRAQIRNLAHGLEVEATCGVEWRLGNLYRRAPTHANGDEEVGARRTAQAHPSWLELLVGFGSPAVAAALYKVITAWLRARAGRQIKLKFGHWEANFKGFSERKIAKLLRVLSEVAAAESRSPSGFYKHPVEAERISRFVKEDGIPASIISPPKRKALPGTGKALSRKRKG